MCFGIGLRLMVPDHFRRHGFHVLDRLIGILGPLLLALVIAISFVGGLFSN